MLRPGNQRLSLLLGILLAIPAGAFAHHISMSFSSWELKPDQARVVFRLPLADAVWIMDPSLVIKQEVMIQIKAPVDETLKGRVEDYLEKTLPQKVTLAGCKFQPEMAVRFEGQNVQVEAKLVCAPGYLQKFALESHFLVEENRLHTSLATLNFPDRLQQCLFRSGQFTCGVKSAVAEAQAGPAWQARIAPWWDYLALGLIILLFSDSAGKVAWSLALLILGLGLAPLALRLGLPIPSSALPSAALAALPIYGGLLLWAADRGFSGRAWTLLAAGHFLVIALAWAEFLRLSPLMVAGLFLIAASVGATGRSPLPAANKQTALYLLALTFGLLSGLILLRHPPTLARPDCAVIALLALALAWPLRKFIFRFQVQAWAGLFIAAVGLLIFALRNVNLSFSAFQYENARELLRNLVQSPELGGSFLLLALVLALVIGGLHALTPGHGKTIVAAYLVGSKGRTLDAVLLGGIVTLTHTSSVILLAVLALFASRYILPDQLVPWLSLGSGGLIFVLGGYLFQSRLRNYLRSGTATPVPEFHDHHHDHPHSHDGVTHTHALPPARVGLGSLVALGVTGGIVPCPDALAVLLIAVSLNRILLGLSVILAFSLGLAAVLIAIGIVMVKARPLLDRFTGQSRATTLWLPLASATVVSLLGAAMVWKAL
jgi:ABC-type nickel/cobalt efflux system permease component RcnA